MSEHSAVRRIINETEYHLVIEIFGNEEEKLIYEVAQFDTLDIAGVCTSGIETYCDLGWRTSYAFANVYFDNERILRFSEPGDDWMKRFINADPIGGFGLQQG